MMPTETTNTTQSQAVTGIEPELLEIGLLFADLTPQERTQAWSYLVSLRQTRST